MIAKVTTYGPCRSEGYHRHHRRYWPHRCAPSPQLSNLNMPCLSAPANPPIEISMDAIAICAERLPSPWCSVFRADRNHRLQRSHWPDRCISWLHMWLSLCACLISLHLQTLQFCFKGLVSAMCSGFVGVVVRVVCVRYSLCAGLTGITGITGATGFTGPLHVCTLVSLCTSGCLSLALLMTSAEPGVPELRMHQVSRTCRLHRSHRRDRSHGPDGSHEPHRIHRSHRLHRSVK